MKNQKGITLIALVITIIVLLILAGITIAMLTGDNGLLTKSQQAAKDNALGGVKDKVILAIQEGMTSYLGDYYSASSQSQRADMSAITYCEDAIKKVGGANNTSNPFTVDGCTVTITTGDKIVINNDTRKCTIDITSSHGNGSTVDYYNVVSVDMGNS